MLYESVNWGKVFFVTLYTHTVQSAWTWEHEDRAVHGLYVWAVQWRTLTVGEVMERIRGLQDF